MLSFVERLSANVLGVAILGGNAGMEEDEGEEEGEPFIIPVFGDNTGLAGVEVIFKSVLNASAIEPSGTLTLEWESALF